MKLFPNSITEVALRNKVGEIKFPWRKTNNFDYEEALKTSRVLLAGSYSLAFVRIGEPDLKCLKMNFTAY